MVDAHGVPRPRMNADLSLRGRFFEVDALWERRRVAVELDSRGVHGTKKRFESDRQRDRILVAEGYRTMRVTWRQLHEEPDEIVADLKSALRQPGHHPPLPALWGWVMARRTEARFTLGPYGAGAFRALPA